MKVQSTNLREVEYQEGVLQVTFKNGRVWKYLNVSRETYLDLIKAESVGAFFYRNIRGRYTGEDVTPREARDGGTE